MSDNFSYQTIKKQAESLHKDRGSKFYGYVFHVMNEEEVKIHLDDLHERYPDATHICYALVFGVDQDYYRTNDDGEPSNSAGQPIYREIQSANLTYVLVAVVRYYGGKKLGVPGLIDAYGTSARMALEEAGQKTEVLQKTFLMRDRAARDYRVYEYASRLGYAIEQAPERPGGFFQISLPLSSSKTFVNSLHSLPNFELQDKTETP